MELASSALGLGGYESAAFEGSEVSFGSTPPDSTRFVTLRLEQV